MPPGGICCLFFVVVLLVTKRLRGLLLSDVKLFWSVLIHLGAGGVPSTLSRAVGAV